MSCPLEKYKTGNQQQSSGGLQNNLKDIWEELFY